MATTSKKPVAGKSVIHLYRLLSEQGSEDAKKMMFPTEDKESISNDTETTITKDGSETSPKGAEVKLSSTNLFGVGDPTAKKLKNACKKGEEVEAWVVDLAEPTATEGKHPATYYKGFITSYEKTAPAEGFVEISVEYSARGIGVDGEVTLSAEQTEEANYVFEDVLKKGGN